MVGHITGTVGGPILALYEAGSLKGTGGDCRDSIPGLITAALWETTPVVMFTNEARGEPGGRAMCCKGGRCVGTMNDWGVGRDEGLMGGVSISRGCLRAGGEDSRSSEAVLLWAITQI